MPFKNVTTMGDYDKQCAFAAYELEKLEGRGGLRCGIFDAKRIVFPSLLT